MEIRHNDKGVVWDAAWARLPQDELKKVAPHLFYLEALAEDIKKKEERIRELEEEKHGTKLLTRSEKMKEVWRKKKEAAAHKLNEDGQL